MVLPLIIQEVVLVEILNSLVLLLLVEAVEVLGPGPALHLGYLVDQEVEQGEVTQVLHQLEELEQQVKGTKVDLF
jgi:hypothetical protein